MSSKSKVALTAKWQLDAALLSRPVDLTALVSMSKNNPEKFLVDNTLQRLVSSLLNEKNSNKSDHDTKLDVLSILSNVAGSSAEANDVVRQALQGVSDWFDEYIASSEMDPGQEPELHKAMVLLLARCWDYALKTEDVLELTQDNRRVALCTVVGLLEDGETYSTELKQRQAPSAGKMAQWEHELVVHRYEKPLLLQICRLLRGFTHPGTYFAASQDAIALHSIERFADEMDILLDITLRSRLVEKLSSALYDCLFEEEDEQAILDSGEIDDSIKSMSDSDHMAVVSVHAFLQNLYFYATENNEEFRQHMLMETLLIPRLILPYLDRCIMAVKILNSRAEAYKKMLDGDDHTAEMALKDNQLAKGIVASLRTLIIASFRAPATQFVMTLLQKLNPTSQILQASSFCKAHEDIFALLCLLNVNMGALDLSKASETSDADTKDEVYHAHSLLHDLASIYAELSPTSQSRVYKRVAASGTLPISRDTPSYVAVMSVLHGGAAGQLEYVIGRDGGVKGDDLDLENEDYRGTRAEAKQAHAARMASLNNASEHENVEQEGSNGVPEQADSKSDVPEREQSNAKGGTGDHKSNSQYPENKASHSGESKNGQSNSFRLLGALPGLGPKDSHKDDVKLALALELPSNFKKESTNKENQNSDSGKMNSSKTLGVPTVSIPLSYFPYILYNW
jgi:hypothetical protein